MPKQVSKAAALTPGKLSKTNFKTWDEFYQEIIKATTVSFDASDPGIKGDKGVPGTTPKAVSTEHPVANGDRSVDVGFDCTDAIVNLINKSDVNPTIAISAIDVSVVYLTAVTATANYVVKVTRWTTEEEDA